MTGPSIPPLRLEAIEERVAGRAPAEDAAKRAAVTGFLVGRDAVALGEEYVARGDLAAARRW
ncbi:MAG: hypothetical protein M3422_24615, partial [Actinomycetota bacterium]|nr:hypothetical protein [Actinomycetota bacterium]